MAKHLASGIEIGTQNIRIGLAESISNGETVTPNMVGFGYSASKGLRHGYVTEKEELAEAIKITKKIAEKNAGQKIKKAILAVGGVGLSGFTTSAEIAVSKGDLEVTDLDLEKLSELCQENIPKTTSINRKILHIIPLLYKLDGKPIYGSPVGMKGAKLEVKCLFINVLEKHLDDLVEAVEDSGIEVSDLVAAPIAAGLILLSKQQRRVGCALVNIGSETVSIIVYENGIPISLEVIPTGSSHITNDIALGLKVSLEEAEHIKQGGLTTTSFPRKKLEEIIEARLSDIFDAIEAHLKKIGRNGLLPAGIIFYGGGSNIVGIEDLAKEYLKLPARIGMIPSKNSKEIVKNSAWATVYGLCLLGFDSEATEILIKSQMKIIGRKIRVFLKQFMP